MDSLGPLNSVSTADPTFKRCPLGHAESAAMKTAKLQAQGKPWLCSKRKVMVTNEQCIADHVSGEDRACRDCGIPAMLQRKGEVEMASTKKGTCEQCKVKPDSAKNHVAGSEAVASNLSWDEFAPLDLDAPAKALTAYAAIGRGRLSFSRAATRIVPFELGGHVEIRYSEKQKALALKESSQPSGFSRKITGDKGGWFNLSIFRHAKAWSLPEGRFEVEVTPWGCIVHLDRPASVPAVNSKRNEKE